MRLEMKIALAVAALAAAAACGKNQAADDQNVVITNEVPPDADIEALPPDESSGTSTEDLANGADDADLNDSANAPENETDSY